MVLPAFFDVWCELRAMSIPASYYTQQCADDNINTKSEFKMDERDLINKHRLALNK